MQTDIKWPHSTGTAHCLMPRNPRNAGTFASDGRFTGTVFLQQEAGCAGTPGRVWRAGPDPPRLWGVWWMTPASFLCAPTSPHGTGLPLPGAARASLPFAGPQSKESFAGVAVLSATAGHCGQVSLLLTKRCLFGGGGAVG